MNHRTTYITALSIVAGAALIAACSSSSTTTTANNTGKDGGGSGGSDEDAGSSGGDNDSGSSGGDTDSGGSSGMDSGGGGSAKAGEACSGPTGGQGGCDTGLLCENFPNPSKMGNFCTKACSDPGNATSADCAGNAAYTGKCTPNSYCQLK